MSKKRRQRSTKIRKRIEKKQREVSKAAKKEAKNAGKPEDYEELLRCEIPRDAAISVVQQISGLAYRLSEEPIRGWTPDDLDAEFGLSYLLAMLSEELEIQVDEDPLTLDFLAESKRPLLDQMTKLELAASSLEVDWDTGLQPVLQALNGAEPLPEPEPEEGGGSEFPHELFGG